jgi:hypothetical protein
MNLQDRVRELIDIVHEKSEEWKKLTSKGLPGYNSAGDAEGAIDALLAQSEEPGATPFDNHEELAKALHDMGWSSPCDAQWDHLRDWCAEMRSQWLASRPVEAHGGWWCKTCQRWIPDNEIQLAKPNDWHYGCGGPAWRIPRPVEGEKK